jgi:hypothetical protein
MGQISTTYTCMQVGMGNFTCVHGIKQFAFIRANIMCVSRWKSIRPDYIFTLNLHACIGVIQVIFFSFLLHSRVQVKQLPNT